MIGWPADYFITCDIVLTRSNKVETSVVGFQFGLCHVIVPLSFLQYVLISIMPGWFFQWSDHVVSVDIY